MQMHRQLFSCRFIIHQWLAYENRAFFINHLSQLLIVEARRIGVLPFNLECFSIKVAISLSLTKLSLKLLLCSD